MSKNKTSVLIHALHIRYQALIVLFLDDLDL